jgi:hypothetical protein
VPCAIFFIAKKTGGRLGSQLVPTNIGNRIADKPASRAPRNSVGLGAEGSGRYAPDGTAAKASASSIIRICARRWSAMDAASPESQKPWCMWSPQMLSHTPDDSSYSPAMLSFSTAGAEAWAVDEAITILRRRLPVDDGGHGGAGGEERWCRAGLVVDRRNAAREWSSAGWDIAAVRYINDAGRAEQVVRPGDRRHKD